MPDDDTKQAEHDTTVEQELRYLRARDEARNRYAAEVDAAEPDTTYDKLLVDGAAFILDIPPGIPAIWGSGDEVLWAEGESLLICGPPGVGKTTLAGLVLTALLGLRTDVLGLPVKPCTKVLYLAMDRPQQIARALARQVHAEHREVLAQRLVVWQGPPPSDLAKRPSRLAELAKAAGADVVILDSLKDAAVGLSEDEVGAGYNRARQLLLREGVELAELHHTVKRGGNGGAPTTLADVYGSTWITSGAGSAIMLSGEAGDPVVNLRHLKQPAAEVGPYSVLHDQTAGTMSIEHAADLVAIARASAPGGLTAKAAAMTITDKTDVSKSEVEKARRKLDRLAKGGLLAYREGSKGGDGGKTPGTWHATSPFTKPIHAPVPVQGVTEQSRHARSETYPQVGAIHGTDHAMHAGAIHEPHCPRRGQGEGTTEPDEGTDPALALVQDVLGGVVIAS